MSSIDCAGTSCVEIETDRPDAPPASAARVLGASFFSSAAALAAASHAACAQSSVVSKNSGFIPTTRQASLERQRTASLAPERRVASVKKHTPFARHDTAATPMASQGLRVSIPRAHGPRTAKSSMRTELTAAHPTLPFGTRLRVTNVATRAVRDRTGQRPRPVRRGRVVDVSYSANNALGMVGRGCREGQARRRRVARVGAIAKHVGRAARVSWRNTFRYSALWAMGFANTGRRVPN